MNLLLLHLFARDTADRLAGRRVDAISWFPPMLSVAIGGRRRDYLVAVMEAPGPFVFLSDEKPFEGAHAPRRFSTLVGATLASITQVAGDRVLQIDAAHPDDAEGPALSFELHLYGALASAVLRRGDSIIESIGRRHRGRREPGGLSTGLVDIAPDALASVLGAGASEDESPQARVPGLDRALLTAFVTGSDVDVPSLVAFRDQLVAGDTPYALTWSKKPGDAVPVPLSASRPRAPGPFRSARDACKAAGAEVLAGTRRRMIDSLARPLRRRLASNQKLARNLQGDVERAREHGAVRREAEILAAFQTQIPSGAGFATLDDIYSPGERVTIELDPAEPLHVQIERRFRRATKFKKSLTHASRRLELVARESAELSAVLQLLSETPSLSQALLRLEAVRARFGIDSSPSASTRTHASNERTLRRLQLDSNWFVIVGRNNLENDEVTFRHASPRDLWFHAQGVPGSHVILKSHSGAPGNPPAAIVERAAGVAAHFSRARHSGLVPVIYTERRYVRKFRGAKPGQVTCEREKMVMVEPKLPQTSDS